MKRFSALSFGLVCAAALAGSGQLQAQKANLTTVPWELAASGTYSRADVPSLAQAVGALNTQLVPASLAPISSHDFGMPGAAVEVQHNFQSCLGFQFSISGGYSNRTILVPTADSSVFPEGTFHATPRIITAAFGPVFTMNRGHHVEFLFRVLGGAARADAAPDAAFKTAVESTSPAFTFAQTSAAADGGFGVDVPMGQRFAMRVGIDDVSTWLSGARQDQLRASAGIVWKFGRRTEIFDSTQYE